MNANRKESIKFIEKNLNDIRQFLETQTKNGVNKTDLRPVIDLLNGTTQTFLIYCNEWVVDMYKNDSDLSK